MVGNGLLIDNIFRLESAGYRDGCYKPYDPLSKILRANGYQQHIADILAGDAAKLKGSEFFAETIVSTILKYLGRGA